MSEIAPELQQALSDRYRIERELGRGGMSVVFLAEDLKHSRQVALKVLAPGSVAGHLFYAIPYIDGESLRSRLDRERQLGRLHGAGTPPSPRTGGACS